MAEPVADHGVGLLLRQYRIQLGVSQRRLAERSNISVRAIRDIELGCSARPRRETVRLVADGLGLNRQERTALEVAAGHPMRSSDLPVQFADRRFPPPASVDGLIGRTAELSTVLDMVSPGGARLVTVTGLPGMGKSRFALAVAAALHTRSRVAVLWRSAGNQRLTGDGSWPAGSDHLSETVRDRLDGLVRDSAGAGSALCAVIAQAPTLLVLDGFGGADVWRDRLVALLQECPRLRALIIAERGTGLPWERVVPLAPLAIPGPALEQAASIRFLLSRVRQVRPDFRVTEENSPDLGRLACQVDGIPVALEAIAFLLGLYQPGQLSELIVDDPLAFLTATGAAPGVRRLRDGLASALDALDPVRRSQLRGLASTRSGWSVPEAAELLGVSPAVGARFIGELLVSGLIRPDEATRSRYRVLSVVRTALRS